MARHTRIHLPGGVCHVMLRGNGGREIFLDPGDGTQFLALLAEGTGRFGFRCHGYCLMPNHVHLVLQAGAAPLSAAMQNLAFRYTRHVNAREKRIGHLFQGRYRALLVDADSYLLELVRCVLLNPVRAGPLSALAARFGRDPTSLSLVPDDLEARAGRDPELAKTIARLNNTIIQA